MPAKARQTRASVRATDKGSKKKKAGAQMGIQMETQMGTQTGAQDTSTSIEDAVYSLGNHKPRGAFNVFYEGTSNSPGNMTNLPTDGEFGLDPRLLDCGYELLT